MSLGSIWGAREEEPKQDLSLEEEQHQQRIMFASGYLRGLVAKHGTWIATKKHLNIENTMISADAHKLLTTDRNELLSVKVGYANMTTIMAIVQHHMNKVDGK